MSKEVDVVGTLRGSVDGTLELSRHDFVCEMQEIFKSKDHGKIGDLFDAYCEWEIRCIDSQGMSPAKYAGAYADAVDRSARNLDMAAAVADNLSTTDNDPWSTFVLACESDVIGPIREFYRENIDYRFEVSTDRLN